MPGHHSALLLGEEAVDRQDDNRQWTFSRHVAPASDEWDREASLFALADGMLGVRGGIEECQPSGGGVFHARVFDSTPIDYHERFSGFASATDTRLPVADGSMIDLLLGDSRVGDGSIVAFSRNLDLKTGAILRTTRWLAPNGATVDVVARRVVFGGGLLAIRLELQSIDYDGPVSFVSRLSSRAAGASQGDDPRFGVGSGHRLQTSKLSFDRDESWLVQVAAGTGLGVAVAQAHRSAELRPGPTRLDEEGTTTNFAGSLSPGQSIGIEKIVAYVPCGERNAEASLLAARTRARDVSAAGYDLAARAAAAELSEFWEVADVEFPGNPELTLAMRFNLMHLCRSAPADGLSGLAAKGLTGEGYQGHVFWDTEAFAVPVLALTAPDLARGSIAFRIATLDRARAHARQMNHRSGALYPWRTIAGDEGSGYFPAGSAQYHINAAIAFAVKCYDRASGDDAFVLGEAAPMVFETARLWMDVGFHDPDRGGAFRICAVTGPDEYSALVDDDHYTNRLAQEHLAYAVELADRCPPTASAPSPAEREGWARAAASIYLPLDEEKGVSPQDATFLGKPEWTFQPDRSDRPLLLHYHPLTLYRHQVIKQASVILAHAMTGTASRSQQRRDFDYYEPRTAHDSSLSASSHAIVATAIGRSDAAYAFLRDSVFVDLHDLHGNVGHGLHMASIAGGWLALASGFAGMKQEDGLLSFLPRSTPELPAYNFGMQYRGAHLRISVDPELTRYSLGAGGSRLTLVHDGLPVALRPGETTDRPTPRFGTKPAGPLRALLFDLDGVLTDTARSHYIAWQELADELGIPFDEDANESLKGIDRLGSLDLIMRRSTRTFDESERSAFADRKNRRYGELIAGFGPADLLPGAREALVDARADGLQMAIVSASRNAPTLLARLGISHFFDTVVDPASVARGKPDPAIFLKAAQELGVPPGECLGIEDSKAGIEAIKTAGMAALGVGDPRLLTRADRVVSHLGTIDWLSLASELCGET